MIIRNCMKTNVVSIPATASLRDAITLFVARHVGLLPVLDADKRPIGVVGLRDILSLALPSTFHLLSDLDFVGDFGALEAFQPDPDTLAMPVSTLMRPATFVREDSGLIRAYAFMLQHELHDMPVVDGNGRLSGIASRVDIGTRIISNWQ